MCSLTIFQSLKSLRRFHLFIFLLHWYLLGTSSIHPPYFFISQLWTVTSLISFLRNYCTLAAFIRFYYNTIRIRFGSWVIMMKVLSLATWDVQDFRNIFIFTFELFFIFISIFLSLFISIYPFTFASILIFLSLFIFIYLSLFIFAYPFLSIYLFIEVTCSNFPLFLIDFINLK